MSYKSRSNYAPGFSCTQEQFDQIFSIDYKFKEHEIVETKDLIQKDNFLIPKGSVGTIIYIYPSGTYEIEFSRDPEAPIIITLTYKDIQPLGVK